MSEGFESLTISIVKSGCEARLDGGVQLKEPEFEMDAGTTCQQNDQIPTFQVLNKQKSELRAHALGCDWWNYKPLAFPNPRPE